MTLRILLVSLASERMKILFQSRFVMLTKNQCRVLKKHNIAGDDLQVMLQVGLNQECDGGQEDEHHGGEGDGLSCLGCLWILQHVPEI